eukprot:m.287623 g.287623  ORF g.287623 m.287623 type:complete len:133 (+) comp55022_c0_seq3:607-1005(+)
MRHSHAAKRVALSPVVPLNNNGVQLFERQDCLSQLVQLSQSGAGHFSDHRVTAAVLSACSGSKLELPAHLQARMPELSPTAASILISSTFCLMRTSKKLEIHLRKPASIAYLEMPPVLMPPERCAPTRAQPE